MKSVHQLWWIRTVKNRPSAQRDGSRGVVMGDDPKLFGLQGFNDSVGDSIGIDSTVNHWLNKFR
jgi:hypothetical protein